MHLSIFFADSGINKRGCKKSPIKNTVVSLKSDTTVFFYLDLRFSYKTGTLNKPTNI